MPTERRRLAVALGRHDARAAAPAGVDPELFAAACLADTYEVLADLVGVVAAVAAPPAAEELLWPGSLRFPAAAGPAEVIRQAEGRFDEVLLVPADVPDLPGLVLAKVFRALLRSPACVAVERGGPGCVAVGVRLPAPEWVADIRLDDTRWLRGRRVARAPEWHRLRGPDACRRLDPGLEGWEQTRALLVSARVLPEG